MIETNKICKRCKNTTVYNNDAEYCLECKKSAEKEAKDRWYIKNKERQSKEAEINWQKNKLFFQNKSKKYYRENKEKIKKKSLEYYYNLPKFNNNCPKCGKFIITMKGFIKHNKKECHPERIKLNCLQCSKLIERRYSRRYTAKFCSNSCKRKYYSIHHDKKISTFLKYMDSFVKYCECGCGNRIKIKEHNKWYGIPRFIVGHNLIKNNKLVRSELWRKKRSDKLKGKSFEERFGEDEAKRIKTIMKKNRAKQITPVKDTTIEVKIQNFLKALGIEFFTHQHMKIDHGYQCDILIPSTKTIIECDGDYFHFNPKKYKANDKIFKNGITAQERWNLDELRTKELLEKGFRVIRLWGSEIKVMKLEDFKEKLK